MERWRETHPGFGRVRGGVVLVVGADVPARLLPCQVERVASHREWRAAVVGDGRVVIVHERRRIGVVLHETCTRMST